MKEDMSELKKRALAIVDIYSDLNRMTEREADILRKAITTDRPQGKWIEQGYLEYKCSVCGRHISLEDHWTNITKDFPFCHCGADMRKGGAE